MALPKHIRPIHPFPARMAPEIVWDELPDCQQRLRILDPMTGSGTTLVTAKLRGHEVIGFDRDPLAILIARSWLTNVNPEKVESKASQVLMQARSSARNIALSKAYPRNADEETKAFIRYWFDATNRVQLAALSESISCLRDPSLRNIMWCAFSKLIITKTSGVSLAMDVSHSRPHRSYDKAPLRTFESFERAVRQVIKISLFSNTNATGVATSVRFADARQLPLDNNSIDIVITSPPYLNAIDYMRGHKFSLVWMGYHIKKLRNIRATNVGAETIGKSEKDDTSTEQIMGRMCHVNKLSSRNAGMLRLYVRDMRRVMSEIKRVLRPAGKAVLVIGNCNIRDTFIQNSKCLEGLADELGMKVGKIRSRPLPENRRYLPPPGLSSSGVALKKRIREEVILTLFKV